MSREDVKITVRLPRDLVARLDALRPVLANQATLGLHGDLTRTHILRMALLHGVRLLEDRFAPGWTLSDTTAASNADTAAPDIFTDPFFSNADLEMFGQWPNGSTDSAESATGFDPPDTTDA